jgi:hypothetical protein
MKYVYNMYISYGSCMNRPIECNQRYQFQYTDSKHTTDENDKCYIVLRFWDAQTTLQRLAASCVGDPIHVDIVMVYPITILVISFRLYHKKITL